MIVCPACKGVGFQAVDNRACGTCSGGGVVAKGGGDYLGHLEIPAKVRLVAAGVLAAYAAFSFSRRLLGCQPGYALTKFRDEWGDVRFAWRCRK